MSKKRSAGILLHPTSLPSEFGIGDFGPGAFEFVDFLDTAGLGLWQILPCGPPGAGDSPYNAFSAFAGNHLLISPTLLFEEGLLDAPPVPPDDPPLPREFVHFDRVRVWKRGVLRQAVDAFLDGHWTGRTERYEQFCSDEARWLDDYCHFMSLLEESGKTARENGAGGGVWNDLFSRDLILRRESALRESRRRLAREIEEHRVMQFIFFEQWRALKEYVNGKGIKVVGDIPFYVAEDSADVWAHRDLFLLDSEGKPTAVAGVPPDYFSATGQRWGNPLYNWKVMTDNRFAWWIDRLEASFRFADIVRIDHFRGFEAYWEIPAGEETAVNGRWIKAPGRELFTTMIESMRRNGLSSPMDLPIPDSQHPILPIIAEDLGAITPAVEKLRDDFGFPGMYVLQFAFFFDEAGEWDHTNPYLPHNHRMNAAVYTGTHDNDTTTGWYAALDERRKDYVRRYLARDGHDISWDLIRTTFGSPAGYAFTPMQDVLTLGSEARMNVPSTPTGNWSWRYLPGSVGPHLAERLSELARLYGRRKTDVVGD